MSLGAFNLKCFKEMTTIEKLPAEIIRDDILSRLSVDSVFQSKLVCKPWKNLIKDCSFPTMHYNQAIKNPNFTNLLVKSWVGEPEFGYIPDSDVCDKFSGTKNLPFDHFHVVGSCNGLIFMLGSQAGAYTLFNPVIRRGWMAVPGPSNYFDYYSEYMLNGFGYDSNNGVYKAIRIIPNLENPTGENQTADRDSEIQILTLGDCEWRSIGTVDWKFLALKAYWRSIKRVEPNFLVEKYDGVFLNGYIHWFLDDVCEFGGIKSFNVEHETFGLLSLPPGFCSKKRKGFLSVFHLGVLAGHLMVVDYSKKNIKVWVMKNYGVTESWVVEFVIPRIGEGKQLQILKVQTNGNVLIEFNGKALYSYDPETKTHAKLQVSGLPKHITCFCHTGTFVKVEDVMERQQSPQSD